MREARTESTIHYHITLLMSTCASNVDVKLTTELSTVSLLTVTQEGACIERSVIPALYWLCMCTYRKCVHVHMCMCMCGHQQNVCVVFRYSVDLSPTPYGMKAHQNQTDSRTFLFQTCKILHSCTLDTLPTRTAQECTSGYCCGTPSHAWLI